MSSLFFSDKNTSLKSEDEATLSFMPGKASYVLYVLFLHEAMLKSVQSIQFHNFYQRTVQAIMLKRYIRILKYGISLDRAYLLIRVIALIITFIASSISLLLPKYLLNAIAAKKLMQILVLLLATLCSGLINALSEKSHHLF